MTDPIRPPAEREWHRCKGCGAWNIEPKRRCAWCDTPEAAAYAEDVLARYEDEHAQWGDEQPWA